MAQRHADLVRDTSVTTGTGAITVSGTAPTGYRTFSAVPDMTTGDTVFYAIRHQSADEWETGLGTYSAANTITRTTVFESSNSDAAVNFSAGTKDVYITQPAKRSGLRETLLSARTYYVSPSGSDSNSGTTTGSPWATLDHARDVIATLDLNGWGVTVRLMNGTHTSNANWWKPVLGGTVYLVGDDTNAGNVILNTGGTCVDVTSRADIRVRHMRLQSSDNGLRTIGAGARIGFEDIQFGACAGAQIMARDGSLIAAEGNYTILGNANTHYNAVNSGQVESSSRTITLTGTPAFSIFAYAINHGRIPLFGNTFSGSATGERYNADSLSIINTFGAGGTHLPGNAAGNTYNGSLYL